MSRAIVIPICQTRLFTARRAVYQLLVVIGVGGAVFPDVTSGQGLPSEFIVTVAGDSLRGFNGDLDEKGRLRPASGAQLFAPLGLAVSPSGRNLYIADSGNHRVRVVDTRYWDILTVAGNGSPADRGDDELATNASLRAPAGVALGDSGHIYIADELNNRIRLVTSEKNIVTIAGGGGSDIENYGDGGDARAASLSGPKDIAIGADGTLYISDSGHRLVRAVEPMTNAIRTIAGNGQRRYNGDDQPAVDAALDPGGICLDGQGGLLIADSYNHRIRRLDLESGMISTFAGSGRGFDGDGYDREGAKFRSPSDVAVSARGDVYVVDKGNRRVRKISKVDNKITTVVGSDSLGFSGDIGPAVLAGMSDPYGIAIDAAENLYVSDYADHRVRRINFSKGSVPQFEPRQRSGRPWWQFAAAGGVGVGGYYFFLRPPGTSPLPKPPTMPAP
jgi:DNA-binding beta-propeller fold protein YncE